MKVVVLILIFLFSACENPNSHSPNLKCKLINEVRRRAAQQIFLNTRLVACGTGAQAMNEIKMLALSFNYHHEINVKEGRELLIAALDTFRSVINADENIRPYLANFPFETKNIEIRIFIQNEDGTKIGFDKLCVISAIEGIFQYKIHTPDGLWLDIVHQETYEEALQKL